MEHDAKTALEWIKNNAEALTGLSDDIWSFAELGLHETESARAQQQYLSKNGFAVTSGVAGMPTAFFASWGTGTPHIGFLGEFDALPGCSNRAVAERDEVVREGPGHACGHNLLGVASLAAAIAMKAELEESGKSATVTYFGCPAEENFGGKAFMARAGLFDALDVALTWHPGAVNTVRTSSSLAINSMNVHFHGRTAHASGAPHHGRSALDAVEIMNVGTNYLREHVIDKARIHYVTTNGGLQPNVVPAQATVWYYVRAPERVDVDEIYERVLKCAKGAAIMTETTYDVEFLDALYNVLRNQVLEGVLQKALDAVGAPVFSQADFEFAKKITKTFPKGQKDAITRESDWPEEVCEQTLNTTIVPPATIEKPPTGSTDVGDVSWVVPTAQISTACYAIGTAGHSWQITAQSGMGIGHSGMLTAAKALAVAGLLLVDSPETIELARKEFLKRTGGRKYRCAIPEDVEPAFAQLDPNKTTQ